MNDNREEQNAKLIQLADEVMTLSRNTLLVNLRFLDMALSRFEFVPAEKSSLLTDGIRLFFNPKYVLRRYAAESSVPVRDLLHVLMHCIFSHMYMDPTLDRSYWDLACDIAVEYTISGMGLQAVSTSRDGRQKEFFDQLRTELKYVTAEKIYDYLKKNSPDKVTLADIRGLFYSDNHEIWYMTQDEIRASLGLDMKKQPDNPAKRTSREGEYSRDYVSSYEYEREQIKEDWQKIAEKVKVDLETFSLGQNRNWNGLTQNLNAVTRERYDYSAFLRKFAVIGETMKINEDEFDYVYYTYGLKLYDKIPLIEPLEYKETRKIRDFAIAIDTSGSTSGDLVQKFLQKTYNILMSTESFFKKTNLHIIQCDETIWEDAIITNQVEFEEYLKTMKIRGLGGTDFRPVFEYVDDLRKERVFTNLKGLIYFTDGFGIFPEDKPDYKTAFVYIDDEYNNPQVPSWAIKLVLQSREI